MQFNLLSFVFIFILFYYSLCRNSNKPKKIQNQNFSFPDTFNAPNNNINFKYKSKIPLLSKVFLELNPSLKIKKIQFIQSIKYSLYNLSRSELEEIFSFVDLNKQDVIEMSDWENFVNLYILPFEACNDLKNKENFPTYILSEKEFKKCLKAEPAISFIDWRRRNNESKFQLIMKTITTRGKYEINFGDYLTLRRALFGWSKCHNHNKFLSLSGFICAIKVSLSNIKYVSNNFLNKLYDLGLKFQGKDFSLIRMDFITYLRVVYYTKTFGIFGNIKDLAYIEQHQFLKGVKEDRLPNNFEESEIELFYKLTNREEKEIKNVLSIESFFFFFHFHRLFNLYSINRPLQLNLNNLLDLLNDNLTPIKIVISIDLSISNFNEAQYQEASLILQKRRPNENNFYFSFIQTFNKNVRQDASRKTRLSNIENTTYASYYDTNTTNLENRKTFFGIFTEWNKDYWTKTNFYRAFQLANLYISLSEDLDSGEGSLHDKRPLTTFNSISALTITQRIEKAYSIVYPPISSDQRRNFVLYKIFPPEIWLDLITFLKIENFAAKIISIKGEYIPTIPEHYIKVILKSYNMENMTDTVLDTAKTGYDSLRRRIFDTKKLFDSLMLVEASAAEIKRTSNIHIKYELKDNKDLSRLYLSPDRRFESTPLV